MAKEITNSVETIEVEAEKILEETSTRASEFLLRFYEGGGREYNLFSLKTPPVFAKAES
jgi:hypothetical protein